MKKRRAISASASALISIYQHDITRESSGAFVPPSRPAFAPPAASPFDSFEEDVRRRIAGSDADGTLPPSVRPTQPTADFPAFVTSERMAMLARGVDGPAAAEGRRGLVESLRAGGGCLVVELDEAQAGVVDGMWDFMDELYCGDTATAGGGRIPFRHQDLPRTEGGDGCGSAAASTGYTYLETGVRRRDGSLLPENLADMVGRSNADRAATAYKLFAEISRDVSVAVLAADAGADAAARLMEVLGDDGEEIGFPEELSQSCTVHRLGRYLHDGPAGGPATERIRSHTDWTFVTLVPVAAVPGLEIWWPRRGAAAGSWEGPEPAAQRRWDSKHDSGQPTRTGRWNSGYVVAVAGKWLEIVSQGGAEAGIHRVATGETRSSAPFFWRPRQRIPEDIQRRFGRNGDSKSEECGAGGAARLMGGYILDTYGSWNRYAS